MIKKSLTFIRLIRAIDRLSRKPEDTQRVFDIVDLLIQRYPQKLIDKAEADLKHRSEFREFYAAFQSNRDKYSEVYDIEALYKLPVNTFGHHYAQYMIKHGIKPDYYQVREETHLLWFMRNRLAQTHDIFHFLTGFDCNDMEEYGLQAFYLGQEISMVAFCIMLAGFWKALKSMKSVTIRQLMEAVTSGYLSGKSADNLLFVLWEDLWEQDLEQVRRRFNITLVKLT